MFYLVLLLLQCLGFIIAFQIVKSSMVDMEICKEHIKILDLGAREMT